MASLLARAPPYALVAFALALCIAGLATSPVRGAWMVGVWIGTFAASQLLVEGLVRRRRRKMGWTPSPCCARPRPAKVDEVLGFCLWCGARARQGAL